MVATLAGQASPDGRPAHRYLDLAGLALRLRAARRSLDRRDRPLRARPCCGRRRCGSRPTSTPRCFTTGGCGARRGSCSPARSSRSPAAGALIVRPRRRAPAAPGRAAGRSDRARTTGRSWRSGHDRSFPLRYAHGNVLLGRGGEAAGLYRLAMTSYPYLPTGGKWALAAPPATPRAHRSPRTSRCGESTAPTRLTEYVEHTAGLLDERHQDRAAWQAFLAGPRAAAAPARLAHPRGLPRGLARRQARRPGVGSGLVRERRSCAPPCRGAGRDRRPPPRSPAGELSELATREQRVFERVNGVIGARRASTVELQWLLRRAACRGIGEPELDRHWAAGRAHRLRARRRCRRSSRSAHDLARGARTPRSPSASRR